MDITEEKELERRKRIKKYFKKIKKVLSVTSPEVQSANETLVENLSFVIVVIEDLKEYITIHGIKEEYQNGENQKGFKESVESKTYNQLIKSYLAMMKVLNSVLPNDAIKEIDDAFAKFKEL